MPTTMPFKTDLAKKIKAGRKTTTLRTSQHEGRYDVVANKKPVCQIFSKCRGEFHKDDFSEKEWSDLAYSEGFNSAEEFETVLRSKKFEYYGRNPYRDFVNGERTLWLHDIKVVEDQEGDGGNI